MTSAEGSADLQARAWAFLEEALTTLEAAYSDTIGSLRSWFIGYHEYRAAYERVQGLKPELEALAAELRTWRAASRPESESREAAIELLALSSDLSEARTALEDHCWKMWRKIRFEEAYPRPAIERDILAVKMALSRARRASKR